MDWTDIIKTIGTNAVFLTVLGFLAKSIFSQMLSRDIEKFRAELGKVAFEHQIRFSKLHEKRAEVIAELYYLLVTT